MINICSQCCLFCKIFKKSTEYTFLEYYNKAFVNFKLLLHAYIHFQ